MAAQLDECQALALEALARGKYLRFGFYAAQWQFLNRRAGDARRENPFLVLREQAWELSKPTVNPTGAKPCITATRSNAT